MKAKNLINQHAGWSNIRPCIRLLVLGSSILLAACVHVVEGDDFSKRESDEEVAKASVELGMAHLRNGNRIQAKKPLLHAVKVYPRSREAHHGLALLYAGDQEYALAEQHYLRALALDSSFTKARNNYGAFLYSRGRAVEAVEQLEIAANDTLYVRRGHVFENLGRAYLAVGDKVSASNAFSRAVNLNRRLGYAHLELAQLQFEVGELEAAYNHFNHFSALSRPTARSLWLGIQLQRQLENSDAVASYALQLRSMYPASEEYRQYRESTRQ